MKRVSIEMDEEGRLQLVRMRNLQHITHSVDWLIKKGERKFG